MNKILILLIGILLISCNQPKKEVVNVDDTAVEPANAAVSFDWLLGKWKRTNDKAGKETFENWQKNDANEYIGFGFTLQDQDTIQQEKMRLISLNDHWSLEVQPQDEPQPISFLMTSYNDHEFTCEKKDRDFPNKIKYWKNGDKLNAMVSGSDLKIPFEFERLH